MGVDLHQSILTRVTLRDCNLAYANLAESKLEQVTFTRCDMHEATLAQLKLKKLQVEGCNLMRAEFFGTRLRGVDLSGSELAGIRVSNTFAELSGAKIGLDQAVDLVSLLGVKLVDAD